MQVRYGDTAELAAAILEEGNNSPADVFFAQDAGALGAIQKAGKTSKLLEQLLNQSGVLAPIDAVSRLEAHPSCCYDHQQIEWALQLVPLDRRCRGQPIGLKRSHRRSVHGAHVQTSARRSACKKDDVQSLDLLQIRS